MPRVSMSDPRHQYVAVRLEAALDGIKYSPSIVSVFDNAKVQEELAKFYAANGPPCIAFTVDRTPDEETQQHKLSFYSGAPKSKPDTRSAARAPLHCFAWPVLAVGSVLAPCPAMRHRGRS